jgi:hypothetical protein
MSGARSAPNFRLGDHAMRLVNVVIDERKIDLSWRTSEQRAVRGPWRDVSRR